MYMLRKAIIFTCFLLFPLALFAHGSHGNGIMAGFTHPIFGLDHAVAILGTGFLSYLLDKPKWYLYLAAFITAMIIGGLIGIDKEATWGIEKAIAVSVLLISLFIFFYEKIDTKILLISLVAIGSFHGFAHGAEMPESINSSVYISGYSLGALLMGIIGMLISRYVNSQNKLEQNIRFISGVILGCSIMILLN